MLIKAGFDRLDLRAVNERIAYHTALLRKDGFPMLFAEGRAKQIIANERRRRHADKSGG